MNETNTLKVIPRPVGSRTSGSGEVSPELIKSLLELPGEQALQYQLPENIHFPNWHSNLRNAMLKRGHLLHYRLNRGESVVTLWTTPRE